MASLMNELLEVLENEEAGYRELVEASTRKKEVIIKADIRALEEITAEEQEIAGKIKNIENKRISIMEDIANVLNRKPEDLTVDALLEILANQPKEQEQLAKIRLQLKDTLTEMKNINEQNQTLVNQAMELVDDNTVVVVVDTNKPSYTECEELLYMTKTIVVLDHHRRGNEVIQNAVLSYVEPYASSTCEMVAEILQYFSDDLRLRNIEADCIYAGIMIDTNNFITRAGVRTFEAAAFLRRSGADMTRVRKMLRDNIDSYKARAEAVRTAEIYRGCFAIAKCPSEGLDSPTVVGAQAANELLNIAGVKASFVLTTYNKEVYVSARAIDEVNVQVMMEKLGGGGHINIAGAQVKRPIDEVQDMLKEIIDELYQEEKGKK